LFFVFLAQDFWYLAPTSKLEINENKRKERERRIGKSLPLFFSPSLFLSLSGDYSWGA
jgi:hypothetical protein